MREMKMLVWLTQLGISVAVPLGGFVLLGLWLRAEFGLGAWVVLVSCGLGLVSAFNGLKQTLRQMERMDKGNKPKSPPTVSFNDHE